ncbi:MULTISPECIES: aspartate kinase [Bacillus]|uniref:aspartate kinase n=1 Tax=Bacillus TaxID=1386 RepID=UPI00069E38FD|nr:MULTISPECIES: aspartate kinase [Bacillus]AMQ74127.1 aspartate kinase [Bacillus amyloliquefaciens UMAF6614]AWM47982.1 aspartate kinase [Bacillus amyloliquefaciens]KOC24578.1 aspartate kinase [Bacillus velezensis]KOC26811.1 aspartate kinase [Bacillus velezensis]MBD0398240.1 aspartate kinase [Bacillus sp. 2211]
MKIIVQKFGGTSVKDDKGRKLALAHIKDAISEGYKVVVVVSAMGRKGDPYATDSLIGLLYGSQSDISPREQDMLLSCGETISSVVFSSMLKENGIKAAALTGAQAGFLTNAQHTDAKIIEMKTERLFAALASHDAVVVAGFQGATEKGDTTTIGRGGSDTSAAALGAAVDAEFIDIFTDVEGVMTADPRIVENAKPLPNVTYTEICNLAYQGAKVIHPRAVEIAMQAKVPIRVRSTYSKDKGTLVTSHHSSNIGSDVFERLITGIAHVKDVTQFKVPAKMGQYNVQTEVFKAMANAGISVDFFNITPSEIVYTVAGSKTEAARSILAELGYEPTVTESCAKVSAVGAGIMGVPGVTSKIVSALSDKGIPILQSADSHTTIWVLVHEKDMITAVNALHEVFELSK